MPAKPMLHRAAYEGDTVKIRSLVAGGHSVHERNTDDAKGTALHLACCRHEPDKYQKEHPIDVLLQLGANPNAKDSYKRTPLHLACYYGLEDGVVSLIRAGAELNARSESGKAPLHNASMKTHANGRGALTKLLEAGAEVNPTDANGQTPLHVVAADAICDVEAIVKLVEAGADLGAKTAPRQETKAPTIEAASPARAGMKSVRFKDDTPPTDAAKAAAEVAPVAAAPAAADMSLVDMMAEPAGQTPIELARGAFPPNSGAIWQLDRYGRMQAPVLAKLVSSGKAAAALHGAAWRGDAGAIRRLMAGDGSVGRNPFGTWRTSKLKQIVSIDAKGGACGAFTPLQAAARYGARQSVAALLELGAEVDQRYASKTLTVKQAQTPLQLAAEHGHHSALRLLLEAGAEVNAVGTLEQCTALHLAAGNGHVEVVGRLVAWGADMRAIDTRGWTPYAFAKNAIREDVVAALRRFESMSAYDMGELQKNRGNEPPDERLRPWDGLCESLATAVGRCAHGCLS